MTVKQPTPNHGAQATRTSGSWAKSKERVLVISDAEEMREHLNEILSPEGFVVFDQPSAIGATLAIRHNDIRAVVIDMGVPGIRGEKLISVLRSNPRLQGLVIVVVSATSTKLQDSTEGLESADAVLDRETVEARLAPLLGRLLRSSSFRPQEAFASSSLKP